MSETPPAGYRKLPDGTRCRCIRLWQDGVGGFYCCRSSATLAFGDSLSQHCPNCEEQAAEIEKLREALTKSEALQDLAYYNGAKQYAAISAQSEDAARDWLNGGCGNRQRDAIAALGEAK